MEKLFILIRKDLPLAYQAVQAGHAVAQWMLDNPAHRWGNQTLVYLSVPDETHLDLWCSKLESRGYGYSEFREPDIDNQKTAVACYGAEKMFSKLNLMGA
jgi:hypothetical protein